MEEIKAKDFFHLWLKVVNSRREEMLKLWRNNRELTSFVKGSENSVISQVARELNLLSYEQDYYSIDAVLYRPEDLTPGIKPNTFWFRDIRVAFEHENTFNSGVYQELSHLLITNCGLRVLVTYPNDEPLEELDYLHRIVHGSRHSIDLSNKESLLIILGYENGFEWVGYIYNQQGWKKVSTNILTYAE